MLHPKCLLRMPLLALLATAAFCAGNPDPPDPNSPAVKPYSYRGVDLSGLFDGYFGLNFNHPDSQLSQLRNFDVNAGRFTLNMARLVMERSAAPLGFRVDLGYGKAFQIFNASDHAPAAFREVGQAYMTFKPKNARGFQLDFGKFATSAGAEVIQTNANWNYSRSLLFSCAVPYYHFGFRTSYPVNKYFTAGLQLVNGWNDVKDNNHGKTVGLTASVLTSKFSYTHTYYAGPEKSGTSQGWRQLSDSVLVLAPGAKTSMYINFDYGTEKRDGPGRDHWVGIGSAARFALTRRIALTPRLEWFNDAAGAATGTVQQLKEFTATGEYTFVPGVVMRLEYRTDWSNVPFFDRGPQTAVRKTQQTLLLGLLAWFGGEK